MLLALRNRNRQGGMFRGAVMPRPHCNQATIKRMLNHHTIITPSLVLSRSNRHISADIIQRCNKLILTATEEFAIGDTLVLDLETKTLRRARVRDAKNGNGQQIFFTHGRCEAGSYNVYLLES